MAKADSTLGGNGGASVGIDVLASAPDADIILAIRREPATRIFEGRKLFELRKQLPRPVPRRIFLYQTESSSVIVGHVVVDRVLAGPKELVWKHVGTRGATRKRFFEYFSGWDLAYAYEIRSIVRYREPIKLGELAFDASPRQGVQSFVYLRNDPALSSRLINHALLESLREIRGPLTISPIQATNYPGFVKGVEKHISAGYLETGKTYGKTLLKISDEGDDTEGIFTIRKWTLEIRWKKKLAGFMVLTEKLGGSVKTGPTFFLDAHRDRGLGQRLRIKLHEVLEKFGARKVYATVPTNNSAACSYLLKTGYRIEAHLRRQYHEKHDEFVFGHLIERYRGVPPAFSLTRDLLPLDSFHKVNKEIEPLGEFLEQQMRIFVPAVPPGWGRRQIRAAIEHANSKARAFKARAIFVGFSGSEIHAAAFCIMKRGGSAKIWLLTKSTDRSTNLGLLSFVEKALRVDRKNPIRKFYSTIPLHDSLLSRVFEDSAYVLEGALERPYSNNSDLVVFGKFVT